MRAWRVAWFNDSFVPLSACILTPLNEGVNYCYVDLGERHGYPPHVPIINRKAIDKPIITLLAHFRWHGRPRPYDVIPF